MTRDELAERLERLAVECENDLPLLASCLKVFALVVTRGLDHSLALVLRMFGPEFTRAVNVEKNRHSN